MRGNQSHSRRNWGQALHRQMCCFVQRTWQTTKQGNKSLNIAWPTRFRNTGKWRKWINCINLGRMYRIYTGCFVKNGAIIDNTRLYRLLCKKTRPDYDWHTMCIIPKLSFLLCWVCESGELKFLGSCLLSLLFPPSPANSHLPASTPWRHTFLSAKIKTQNAKLFSLLSILHFDLCTRAYPGGQVMGRPARTW